MKESEYGGSDTHRTLGIFPAPHALTAAEKLRLAYATDPTDPEIEIMPGLPPDALG